MIRLSFLSIIRIPTWQYDNMFQTNTKRTSDFPFLSLSPKSYFEFCLFN